MQPRISLIAAIGNETRVIGKDGKTPWRIKPDMLRFAELTKGHPVIMGRLTWDSLPKKYRPLSERTNIIVTHDKNWEPEGPLTEPTFAAHSFTDGLAIACSVRPKPEEIFVIGGGQIYKTALPFAKRLYLTLVMDGAEGDAFFPEYGEFTKIAEEGDLVTDHTPNYRYLTLDR
jgi:dihydrofolate reductase